MVGALQIIVMFSMEWVVEIYLFNYGMDMT